MSQPARANRDGHPCPTWCTTDHDQETIPGSFSTAHGSEPVHTASWTIVAAALFPSASAPEVQVCTPGADGGSIFLTARKAGYLAVLISELASATPEQHRELADAIRHAAAVITDGGQP
jgi:hypothetical protein